jgi:membrane-bound metal-dependent hydrolase YbcI (DUF457 family)
VLPAHQNLSRWRTSLLAPSRRVIVSAGVVFAVDQTLYQRSGSAVFPQAPLDWTAHLFTTVFIVWAVRPLVSERQLLPALVASVVIDVDHVPGELGSHILTGGASRPYPHSLTTVAALLLLAAARRDRRAWASGATLGVTSHLWRDLAEPQGSSVSLFWPVSDRMVTTPATAYLASIAALAVIVLARTRRSSRSWPVTARAGRRPKPGRGGGE